MATSLFPTNTASAATLPAAFTGTKKLLSLSRGAGVVSQTDNTIASLGGLAGNTHAWGGTVAAVAPKNGLIWVTNPLNAVSFLAADLIPHNIRALESNAMANYSSAFWLYWITADGSTATIVASKSDTVELGTVETAFAGSAAFNVDRTLSAGDRLALVFGYTAGGQVTASGFTVTGFYAGASGATGDSFVTVPTITEQTVAVKARKPVYRNQVPVMRAVLR